MELLLERIYTCPKYTIGKLYMVDDEGVYNYVCDTIEDMDRDLSDDMNEEVIKLKKIYCETAIPTGTYEIAINIKSPKYSNFLKYPWAKKYDGYLPRLLKVKGFDGILIHVGNYASQSCGCILTGFNTQKGMVTSSTFAFKKLMDKYIIPSVEKNEKITITIKQKYKK